MLESAIRERALARVGHTLRGKWILEELIGIGGMAAVYRARHRNGACVAIKLLHASLTDYDDVRRRFVGEGYAANRIAHPSIVRVLDDDVDDKETPFLVMDYVEGRTLADAVEDRRFGDDELLDVGEQICGALAAAHVAGVVHRDLKPDNLLVEPNGRVRVLDFGIARLLGHDEQSFFETKTGIAFGTPGFISPEQALGHREAIGPRTDLFALGATLFYLATGEFLHKTSSPQELLILVATKQARPLREVAPRISPEVAEIVDRATRRDLEDRWASAEAMLEAIRAVRRARRGSLAPNSHTRVPPSADPRKRTSPLPRGVVLATADSSTPTKRISAASRPPTERRFSVATGVSQPGMSQPGVLATRPSIIRRAHQRRSRVLAAASLTATLSLAFVPFVLGATPHPADPAAPRVIEPEPVCAVDSADPPVQPEVVPELQSVSVEATPPVVAVAPPPPKARPAKPNWRSELVRSEPKTGLERIVEALNDPIKPIK